MKHPALSLIQALLTVVLLVCLPLQACFAMIELLPPHWFIEAQGALVKQANEGLAYTLFDTNTERADSPIGYLKRINPEYEVSGGLSIGYLFNNKADIQFSFFINDHTQSSASFASGDIDHLDTLLSPASWLRPATQKATSQYDYKNNSFSVSIGHWTQPTEHFTFHPYLGLSFLNISLQQITRYINPALEDPENTAFIEGDSITVKERSSARQLGPLIGTRFLWKPFIQSVSLDADIGLAVLAGHVRSSYEATNVFENPADETMTNIRSTTDLLVFEAVNLQVGITYYMRLSGNVASHIMLGYKSTQYINSSSTHALPSGISKGFSQHFFEDSAFSGPFLSIALRFM